VRDDQRRSETLARSVVPQRVQAPPLLVLADGYYEWQRSVRSSSRSSFVRGGEPFGMAGLWERWRDAGTGELLESCCIVTTSPALPSPTSTTACR